MSNVFLKIDKDLFNMGLDAFEILIVSQILEYQSKGLECYITNETFAKWYGTSESTIKRRIDNLVSKKIIKRETKNVQKGKERHLSVLMDELESTKVNLNLPQSSNCSLRKDQNEPIKDKDEKINIKDKELVEPQARSKEEAIRDVMSNSTNSEGKFNF